MIKLLVCIALGYLIFAAFGMKWLYDLFTDPVATFNSMPLWFWPIGAWIGWSSFYLAGRDVE